MTLSGPPKANFVPTPMADGVILSSNCSLNVTNSSFSDNRPRILLRATPTGCAVGSVEHTDAEESVNRRRRDVRAASKLRKRTP